MIGETVSQTLNSDEEIIQGIKKLDSQTEQEKLAGLKNFGHNLGVKVSELLSKSRQKITEPLEIVKYICKDLWTYTWGKNADRLRTNYEEMYQIEDNKFKWIFNNQHQQTDSDQSMKLNLAIL